ncbi:hypothetical protein KY290_001199 [Solanum tuberosum]|uniref:Uncharacterized protein n=1 Tax=Solanum tuberosum TaxID=4113 RepID=A0ABQ7WLJ2_SOLTU|nr:hypothetical protein KY290_001199 [Solanum tuberosum]
MASSPKSPGETEIMKPSDSFLALVCVAPLPTIILILWTVSPMFCRSMALHPAQLLRKIVSRTSLWFFEASSERGSREHATIRVALDGFANWSSVSRNHFLPLFTELCPMANDISPVPLSIDTTDEILLANIKPTKGRRRLRTLNRKCASNPVSESSLPTAEPFILGVRVPQTRQKRRQAEVRRGKHIALKSSCSKPKPTPKDMKSSFSKPSSKSILKVRSSRNLVSTSKKKQVASLISSSCSLSGSNAKNLTQSNPSTSSAQLDRIIHFRQQSVLRGRVVIGFGVLRWLCYCPSWRPKAFDVPVHVWVSQTVKDVVGRVNHMAFHVTIRRLDSPLQRLKNQLAEKEHELVVMTTAHQLERESWEARVVALQIELAQERTTNIATVRHLTQLLTPQNPISP